MIKMLTFQLNSVQEAYLGHNDSREVSLKGNVYDFSVYYSGININNIYNINDIILMTY